MPEIPGVEHMRSYLWTVVRDGSLSNNPSLLETVLTALQSTNPNWLPSVFNVVRTEQLQVSSSANREEVDEPLFKEPPAQVLKGSIMIGQSVPSGHETFLPVESFGQRAHIGIYGASGTGKSTLLNSITCQLVLAGVRTFVYDALDQAAPLLVPLLPSDHLNVIDYEDYRRNILLGPASWSQTDWIRQASIHLTESLDVSPVTMNYLIQVCETIISRNQIATIPLVVEYALHSNLQSAKALLNRLLPLTMSGDKTLTCERGFDLEKVLGMSCIFNLKSASPTARKLIANDHYFFMMKTRPALTKWKLNTVLVFHEAGGVLAGEDSFFMITLRESRNFGIGMLFADQAPHLESPAAKSNIGTKILFRLEDPASLEGFKAGMDLGPEQRDAILNLPDRMMLLRRPDIPYPFLVKIPNLF